jgi:hypothetical protein
MRSSLDEESALGVGMLIEIGLCVVRSVGDSVYGLNILIKY